MVAVIKKVLLWALTVFLFLFCFATSISGLFVPTIVTVAIIAFIFPNDKWQEKIQKFFTKKTKKITAIILPILLFLSFATVETTESSFDVGVESPSPSNILASATELLPNETSLITATAVAEPTDVVVITTAPATENATATNEATATENNATASPIPDNTPTEDTSSFFEVHFIDVGQADAALVICDGETLLIDGGNVSDSSKIYTYLKKNNITHLNYVIGTHAHEDHIGGLAGALSYSSVGKVYCPTTSYDSEAFNNFVSAVAKQGKEINVPTVGDTFSVGSAQCEVLAVNTTDDINNTSIVMRIVYGKTSFLFTGDAEREAEQAVLDSGANIQATVLKVGHHGSDTSTGYLWLREIMPEYAVISLGKGNSYGHPTEEVLSRLRDADVKTYRTDMQGDIVCYSDGKKVTFTVSKNADADTLEIFGGNSTPAPTAKPAQTPTAKPTQAPTAKPTQAPTAVPTAKPTTAPEQSGTHYVLNTNTEKFHYPDCYSADKIKDKNREEFYGTRQELIDRGYSPCGNCDP